MANLLGGGAGEEGFVGVALRAAFHARTDRHRKLDEATRLLVERPRLTDGFAIGFISLAHLGIVLKKLPISLGKSSHGSTMADLSGVGYDLGHMLIESVLLTGGASRRMGEDKASLRVDGVPVAERLAGELPEVTVLGRTPVAGAAFLEDAEEYAGPLACLRRFVPRAERVFVLSCDVILFRSLVVSAFGAVLGDDDAVMPVWEGFDQPLCGLYRASAFEALREHPGLVRVRDWTALLRVKRLDAAELEALGVSPLWVQSANTPEDFQRLLSARS